MKPLEKHLLSVVLSDSFSKHRDSGSGLWQNLWLWFVVKFVVKFVIKFVVKFLVKQSLSFLILGSGVKNNNNKNTGPTVFFLTIALSFFSNF